jgi:hypothetical protein
VVVVASASNSVAQEIMGGAKITMPTTAEALLVARGTASGRSVLLVSGNDARGVVYCAARTQRIACCIQAP